MADAARVAYSLLRRGEAADGIPWTLDANTLRLFLLSMDDLLVDVCWFLTVVLRSES